MNRLPSGWLFFALVFFAFYIPGGEGIAQSRQLRVGVLATHGDDLAGWFPTVLRSLGERGWIEGQNVVLEYRMGHSELPQIVKGANELVQDKVDVIVTVGPPAARAAYEATRSIPIVAHDLETDPIAAGFAESYARPGRNLTGFFLAAPELATEWLELLKAIVPDLSSVVVLMDPSSGTGLLRAIERVAPSLHIELQIIEVRSAQDIEQAASEFRGNPQALVVLPSPLMNVHSGQLARLAEQQRLPAISLFSGFAAAGGLFAYGPVWAETYQQFAALIAKVLDGANPADLPIERPARFSLTLNRKAAEGLGLRVPESLLVRADRTIQ